MMPKRVEIATLFEGLPLCKFDKSWLPISGRLVVKKPPTESNREGTSSDAREKLALLGVCNIVQSSCLGS